MSQSGFSLASFTGLHAQLLSLGTRWVSNSSRCRDMSPTDACVVCEAVYYLNVPLISIPPFAGLCCCWWWSTVGMCTPPPSSAPSSSMLVTSASSPRSTSTPEHQHTSQTLKQSSQSLSTRLGFIHHAMFALCHDCTVPETAGVGWVTQNCKFLCNDNFAKIPDTEHYTAAHTNGSTLQVVPAG